MTLIDAPERGEVRVEIEESDYIMDTTTFTYPDAAYTFDFIFVTGFEITTGIPIVDDVIEVVMNTFEHTVGTFVEFIVDIGQFIVGTVFDGISLVTDFLTQLIEDVHSLLSTTYSMVGDIAGILMNPSKLAHQLFLATQGISIEFGEWS